MKDSEKLISLPKEIEPVTSFSDLEEIKKETLRKLERGEEITPAEQIITSLMVHAD
jgi:hypothetical protein